MSLSCEISFLTALDLVESFLGVQIFLVFSSFFSNFIMLCDEKRKGINV